MTTSAQTLSTRASWCELHNAENQRGRNVLPGNRLVENRDLRIVQQRGDDRDLLPHPFGIGRYRRELVGIEREELQHAVELPFQQRRRQAGNPASPNAVHLMMFRWGRRSFYVACQRSPKAADHKVRWSAPPK